MILLSENQCLQHYIFVKNVAMNGARNYGKDKI